MPQSRVQRESAVAACEAPERVILNRQLEGHCFGNQPPCPEWTVGGPPLPNPGKVHDPRRILPRATTEVEWLWDQRIPLGEITVIAGLSGVGKSFLAADLCARTTASISFPPNRISQPEVYSGFYWEMALVRHRVAVAQAEADGTSPQPPGTSAGQKLKESSTTPGDLGASDSEAGRTSAASGATSGAAPGLNGEDLWQETETGGQLGGEPTAASPRGGRDATGESSNPLMGGTGNTRDPKSGSGDQRSSHGLRALVIAGESHPTRQMARRVQQCGGDLECLRILDQVQIFYDSGPAERRPIQFPKDFDLLWPEVSRLAPGGLLVIESLAHSLGRWREREIRAFLQALNELARQRQIAVVLLTGLKFDPRAKLDQRREENWDLARALGSRSLAEIPASIWQLRTNTAAMLSRGGPRELLPLKTRLTTIPMGIVFRLQRDAVDWLPVEIPTCSYDWWQTEIGARINAKYRAFYGKDLRQIYQLAEGPPGECEEWLGSTTQAYDPTDIRSTIPPGILKGLEEYARDWLAKYQEQADAETESGEDAEFSPEETDTEETDTEETDTDEIDVTGIHRHAAGEEPRGGASLGEEVTGEEVTGEEVTGEEVTGDEPPNHAERDHRSGAPAVGVSPEIVPAAAKSHRASAPQQAATPRPTVFPVNPLSDTLASLMALSSDGGNELDPELDPELESDTPATAFAHLDDADDDAEDEADDTSAEDAVPQEGPPSHVRPQVGRSTSYRISRRKARRMGKLRR